MLRIVVQYEFTWIDTLYNSNTKVTGQIFVS
jgi:hypothetical protein